MAVYLQRPHHFLRCLEEDLDLDRTVVDEAGRMALADVETSDSTGEEEVVAAKDTMTGD
jgi:hypothetical protein